ncbi:YadA-like family protein [Burkholderia sp. MSMB1498]|uniref:YadA-like family protein n=1 Tax=Burkholderia sp. MSMB1498 TaxID=1637842 RepID=UPI001E2D8DE2|nr:YadA-like family protein [Burkholderia sp. MSMB1498]
MNRAYGIVWNRASGLLCVASEMAKGRTRRGGRNVAIASVVCAIAFPWHAWAKSQPEAIGERTRCIANELLVDHKVSANADPKVEKAAVVRCDEIPTTGGNNGASESLTSSKDAGRRVDQLWLSSDISDIDASKSNVEAIGQRSVSALGRGNSLLNGPGYRGSNVEDYLSIDPGMGGVSGDTPVATRVENLGAIAIGAFAKATSLSFPLAPGSAIALGEKSETIGGISIGDLAVSSNLGIAIGGEAKDADDGMGNIAMGAMATAGSMGSVAIGFGSSVTGDGGIALGMDSVASEVDTVSVGNDGSNGDDVIKRRIVNVAAGTGEADVVNVSQLKGVANALGGGVTVQVDGSVTAPVYTIDGETYTNVGDALEAAANSGGSAANAVEYDSKDGQVDRSSVTFGEQGVPVALHNVKDGNLAADSTDAVNGGQLYATNANIEKSITNITNQINDGEIGLVQRDADTQVITVAQALGGTTVSISGTEGDRKISGVKAGEDDNDAVNVAQLKAAGLTPANAVEYDSKDGQVDRSSVTFGEQGVPVALHNVKDGNLAADSTDAVNGEQLYRSQQSEAAALSDESKVNADGTIDTSLTVNGNRYASVQDALNAAVAGGSNDPMGVVYDNADHTSVTLGGTGAPTPVTLANVADGKNQYDAVNYGQLSQLQDQVTNLDNRVTNLESGNGGTDTGSNDMIAGTGGDDGAITPANAGNGTGNVAAGTGSAVGNGANNGTAIGANSSVVGENGTAIGANTDAAGNGSTAVGQGASVVSGAGNSVAIGQGSVATEANTVSFGTDGSERRLVNVADGVNATDAATKGQLDRAVGGLQSQMNDVSRNAYSGIAAATALTMIPGVDPGKTLSFGIGGATYRGYQAVAMGGEARITANLKMKIGVGISSGGTTVGAGASYQW